MFKGKIFWLVFDFSYIFFSGMVALALWQHGFGYGYKIAAIVIAVIAFYDYCRYCRH